MRVEVGRPTTLPCNGQRFNRDPVKSRMRSPDVALYQIGGATSVLTVASAMARS